MNRLTFHREKAVATFANPLIALSAVLCVIEGFTPVGTVDFGVCFALAFAAVCRRRRVWLWLLAALTVYIAYAAADLLTAPLAAFLGNKPALFGAVNNVYRLLFGNRLETAVLHTDISGAVITQNGIVTGAADIYLAGAPTAAAAASSWLTAAYYVNVFLPLGAAAFLWRDADKKRRLLLLAVTLLSVLAGDCRLLMAVLLLMSPSGYMIFLLLSALSYPLSALQQSGIGWQRSASVIEFVAGGADVLVILSGIVLAVLYYFAALLWRKKYESA